MIRSCGVLSRSRSSTWCDHKNFLQAKKRDREQARPANAYNGFPRLPIAYVINNCFLQDSEPRMKAVLAQWMQ